MRTRFYTLMSALAAVTTGASNLACNTIDCGDGTVEKDGTCVPGVGTTPASCGPGTKLSMGMCVPDPLTVCDGDTTQEVMDPETGVVTCVGTGGDLSDCSKPRPCPAPQSMKLTLCGQIYDSETDQPVPALASHTGEACTASTTDGPCSLSVRFFDALEFSMNPTGAMPITPASLVLDDCGRFVAENLARPSFGFIGMGVDDASGAPDRYKLTGVATSNAAAAPARNFRAYVTQNGTDTKWSTSAGVNPSFSTRGVLAAVFRYQGNPRSGVQVRRNQNVIPNDDFYFSDADRQRTTVAPAQTMTGANGTVLVINVASASNHDGVGNEPAGCRWPESLAAAIPGVVFVQLKDAETTGGAPCP